MLVPDFIVFCFVRVFGMLFMQFGAIYLALKFARYLEEDAYQEPKA